MSVRRSTRLFFFKGVSISGNSINVTFDAEKIIKCQ